MAFVPDSPAVKRQRNLNGGYNSTSASNTAFNSDDDDGDDLFAGYIPDTPAKAWETQPTQIIDRENQPLSHGHPLPASSPPVVQVPASSPLQSPSPHVPRPAQSIYPGRSIPKPPALFPIKNPPKLGQFGASMAPAGTVFRPPHAISQKPKTFITIDDDDGPKFQGGSSDSETDDRANIQPSKFLPSTTSNSFGASSSGPINGNARFQSIVATSAYNPTNAGPLRQPNMQMKPERAKPVQPPSSINDPNLRDGIQRLRQVYPNITVSFARNALLASRGNVDAAAYSIGNQGRPRPVDAPVHSPTNQARPVSGTPVVELSDDEVELESIKPVEPQMKRGLNAPIISIKDRYSSTQQQPARYQPPPVATPPVKPKRKLMQGRRHPSSPALQPSPLKPQSSPAVSVHDYDSDSGVESAEPEQDSDLEQRVLQHLNSCKMEELIELTNITAANSKLMIDARPFRNLDAARNVTNTALLKGGKKSTRAPIGEKIVETAMKMFQGYEAIDSLVANCERLGKPLGAEMATWGFDVSGATKEGELEMTSFEDDVESQRDSGIGSPSSRAVSINGDAGEEDVKVMTVKRKPKTVNYMKKPTMMADDCVLKDYQVVGLNWLALMYRHKLSGILADEMGLGKTCQVIALISHLVETGHPGPHLVICPGSTLENWLREIPKFSPKLVVEPYYGALKDRGVMADNILAARDRINIVVTTYDLAAQKEDNKFMRRLNPDVAVYDEVSYYRASRWSLTNSIQGHYLKNVNSQRYDMLVRIPGNFKLLLTGTPLQNNLQELAALLAFILPSVFRERADDLNYIFKAKASTRDSDHAALLSAQRIARARSMLTPFVLRRKKAQVLKHLPAKTCRVEYCEMQPAQQQIYDGHIEQARERARIRVEGGKIPKSDENNPLMQLRKASIHPLLFRRHFTDAKIDKMADLLRKKEPQHFDPSLKREHLVNEMQNGSDFWLHQWCVDFPCIKSFDIPNLAWLDSGKVEAMVKLVKAYKENGDRVLIFSQFSLVLDILEAVLNTSLIQFTRIDGSTKIDERQTLIDTFRDDESITAFLLTTKAGGTGINLMYANKVIIFDGSFNPQDDRQAENRAHRVGQTRPVEVVRLVTRNTIEEAIFALGVSKLVLDGRVAGDEDGGSEKAGEKAVAKMILEGTGIGGSKAEEPKDSGDKDVESEPPTSSQRKKTTILDMVTKKAKRAEVDQDVEEMIV
jgi:SWI/SNF-related matrix-associated actin-dependent regulator 1 of chromatin subfamily A